MLLAQPELPVCPVYRNRGTEPLEQQPVTAATLREYLPAFQLLHNNGGELVKDSKNNEQ